MATPAPDRPSGLVTFEGLARSLDYLPAEYDSSLTTQLNALVATAEIPDVFVLTAISAVPVADAIRGYFEANGTDVPVITHVQANQANAHDYHRLNWCESKNQKRVIKRFVNAEVKRLKPVVDGANVCTIDQFVSTQNTIKYAAELLKQAGVKQGTAIRGKWYDQADRAEVDLDTMTSVHHLFMHKLGRHIAAEAK